MLNKVRLWVRRNMATLAVLAVCLGIFVVVKDVTSFWVATIEAITLFLIFGIGRMFLNYKVIWGVPYEDIPVTFHLSWLKKFLLLWIPPDWGEIRAEVDYRYGKETGWQHASVAEWKQSIGSETPITLGSYVNIKGARGGFLITVFKTVKVDSEEQIVTIHPDHQPLPNPFEFKISLIRNADNKLIHEDIIIFERELVRKVGLK
jgi:hypothetical protein